MMAIRFNTSELSLKEPKVNKNLFYHNVKKKPKFSGQSGNNFFLCCASEETLRTHFFSVKNCLEFFVMILLTIKNFLCKVKKGAIPK